MTNWCSKLEQPTADAPRISAFNSKLSKIRDSSAAFFKDWSAETDASMQGRSAAQTARMVSHVKDIGLLLHKEVKR